MAVGEDYRGDHHPAQNHRVELDSFPLSPTGTIEQLSVTFDPRVRWTGDDLQ